MDESQGTVNTNGDCMRKQDGQSQGLPCIINKSGWSWNHSVAMRELLTSGFDAGNTLD